MHVSVYHMCCVCTCVRMYAEAEVDVTFAEAYAHMVCEASGTEDTGVPQKYTSPPTHVTYQQLEEAATKIDSFMREHNMCWTAYEKQYIKTKTRTKRQRTED